MEGVVNEASDKVSEIENSHTYGYQRNAGFARMSSRSPEVAGLTQAGSYKLISNAERDAAAIHVSVLYLKHFLSPYDIRVYFEAILRRMKSDSFLALLMA